MAQHSIHVHNLPTAVDERKLAGSTVIVIDLLRATSTICQALAAGAREVVPFREIEETLAAVASGDRRDVVLGGERGGRRIAGFDLGNSPAEYTSEAVQGRRVLITTTNGTQALYHARVARRVVVGAIVNLSAVVASVANEPRIDVLCAGTGGVETCEDILAAGAIVTQLGESSPEVERQQNAAATTAAAAWQQLQCDAHAAGRSLAKQLAIALRDTLGGRNLIDVGLGSDLADCAAIDQLNIVPELNVSTWRITS